MNSLCIVWMYWIVKSIIRVTYCIILNFPILNPGSVFLGPDLCGVISQLPGGIPQTNSLLGGRNHHKKPSVLYLDLGHHLHFTTFSGPSQQPSLHKTTHICKHLEHINCQLLLTGGAVLSGAVHKICHAP